VPSNLVTHIQLFGIGFSFAVAGPCLIVCTPILVTYITARRYKWPDALIDIVIFLFGRLFAYIALGAIAGLSGFYLRRFIESGLAFYFNPTAGAISILLGMAVLMNRGLSECGRGRSCNNIYSLGSVLALGFIMGVSPCVPLTALLFEIALMSKTAAEGALYALSFGLGTFVAGLIVVGALTGILKGFVLKITRSKIAGGIFRISCAALLILFGLGLILARP